MCWDCVSERRDLFNHNIELMMQVSLCVDCLDILFTHKEGE